MYTVLGERVFPFLRSLGGEGSTYSHYLRDARFTIPTPALPQWVSGGDGPAYTTTASPFSPRLYRTRSPPPTSYSQNGPLPCACFLPFS